ncbi:glycosyltransferase 87 family protein [Streptomyces lucensis]|uniref:glycosyltransferase 87 family protein n=1 Tax=Streptomyces lucensis TaxID=67319 RepID=UPI001E3E99F7|nr:glycosyltransferase 87 family protein [Streptomyces lucensis]
MTVNAFAAARRVPAALGVCLVSFTAFWAAQRAAHVSMIDLMVYRAEGATVRAGGDLYALRATSAHLPTTYPPFAAMLFAPLSLLDAAPLSTLATAGNLVLLVAFVRLSLKLVGHARVETVWWVAAPAVWCEPVWTTLRYGQVNLLLAVLVLWDLSHSPAGGRRRWAGVGLGLAAAVKLTPALFLLFLFLTGIAARLGGGDGRPWLRHARGAAAAFSGATLLAWAVLPYDSWRFWTDMVFRVGRVGRTEDTANQALRGVLARLLHSPDPGALWVATAALAAALGLAAAVAAELRGRRAWAVCACAVTGLLISPVSWTHHWVWCVPLVLLLWTHGHRAPALGMLTAFWSYAPWWVPHGAGRPELHQQGAQLAFSALYAGAGAAFLALAWTSSSPDRPRFGRPGPGAADVKP